MKPRRQAKNQVTCVSMVVIMGIMVGGIFTLWWFSAVQATPQLSNRTNTPVHIDSQTTIHTELPVLLIPAAQVYADVTEVFLTNDGWDVSSLGQKVGYLQGTARPGSEHHVILVGHLELRDGTPGVFAKLNEVSGGDIVILYIGQREIQYTVTKVFETEADNLNVISAVDDQLLTLITCTDYDFLSNSYQKRLVVQAKQG